MYRLRRYWLEITLAGAGILCVGNSAQAWWRYRSFQVQHAAWRPTPKALNVPTAVVHAGDPLGHIAVRRLGFKSIVVEGADEDALGLGVGHLSGSAAIGAKGNAVLAGHRDTSFWPLRHIRRDDEIEVTTDKRYIYRVRSLTVVDPSEVSMLRDTGEAALTLVTCYPFRHVGPAPKRLLIRATPTRVAP